MFTRDEYNDEILETARRVIETAPVGRPVWPLLSKVETAEHAARTGTLADYDWAVGAVATKLLEYVGQSELPDWVERPTS